MDVHPDADGPAGRSATVRLRTPEIGAVDSCDGPPSRARTQSREAVLSDKLLLRGNIEELIVREASLPASAGDLRRISLWLHRDGVQVQQVIASFRPVGDC